MFTARELAEKVVSMLENGQLEAFDIIHTKYRSSVKMEVVRRRLYPLRPVQFTQLYTSYTGSAACIFEPSPEQVLAAMMLKYLKGYIYGCLVHTWICELTSRVTAMDNAIRNGNEMLEALTLTYNRARQAAITQEITEIVAGAAAMND
jgi:F-type H+-transporting ATPase subunit gamma